MNARTHTHRGIYNDLTLKSLFQKEAASLHYSLRRDRKLKRHHAGVSGTNSRFFLPLPGISPPRRGLHFPSTPFNHRHVTSIDHHLITVFAISKITAVDMLLRR